MTQPLPHSSLPSLSSQTSPPEPREEALTLVECAIALCLTLLVVTEALTAARGSLHALRRARDVRQALSLAEELFYSGRFEEPASEESRVCSPQMRSESFVFLRCAPRALGEDEGRTLPPGGRRAITTVEDFYTWSPQ